MRVAIVIIKAAFTDFIVIISFTSFALNLNKSINQHYTDLPAILSTIQAFLQNLKISYGFRFFRLNLQYKLQ